MAGRPRYRTVVHYITDSNMTRVFVMMVAAFVGSASGAATVPWVDRIAEWHECPGGGQECADDSSCCSAGSSGGYLCCQNITMKGGPCCDDGCCTEGETCCSDDKGSSCCLAQTTYCVAKGAGSSFPARCCPQWTVGCEVGSVGCCDPAQPWQWTIAAGTVDAAATRPRPQPSIPTPTAASFHATTPTEAYALVVSGWDSTESSLIALTIDTASGNITKKIQVSGFSDNPAGESTREFLWDPASKKFYYFDVNFTASGGERPSTGRPVFLVSVTPTTGEVTRQVITGALDFPTGFALYGTAGKVLLATKAYDQTVLKGFDFYILDLATATAVPTGSIESGAGEQDPAFYAGYHRVASPDGETVYRVGYKMVTQQAGPGVGVVATAGTAASWVSETTQGHDYFMTANIDTHNVTDTKWTMLSLAPQLSDPKRGLDLVRWSPTDATVYETIATLGNAHPPRVGMGMGFLGYMASAVSSDGTFAALVVDEAVLPQGDRWALAIVDLVTGASKVMPLAPRDIAGTWSVSGLGM
eukprot:m.163433 g.163433  ORF g.163433 m.163433 type:complete len:529 (-) comp23907_c0_seq1:223-1809(-)